MEELLLELLLLGAEYVEEPLLEELLLDGVEKVLLFWDVLVLSYEREGVVTLLLDEEVTLLS